MSKRDLEKGARSGESSGDGDGNVNEKGGRHSDGDVDDDFGESGGGDEKRDASEIVVDWEGPNDPLNPKKCVLSIPLLLVLHIIY